MLKTEQTLRLRDTCCDQQMIFRDLLLLLVNTVYYSILYHVLDFIRLLCDSSGSRILVRGDGGTSDKISYMNFTQVQYCNCVAKISVRERHSAKMDSSKSFNFENFIKKFALKFKKFSKIFQKYNLTELKKI